MFNNLGIKLFIDPMDSITSFDFSAIDQAAPSIQLTATLQGTEGKDSLKGGDGDDTLSGLGGNDTLDGGRGNDDLDGGAGNDVIRGGDGDDVITQTVFKGNDNLDGGHGIDMVYYGYGEAGSSVTVDLLHGSAVKFIDGVKVGADTLHGVEWVTGTVGNDSITGSSWNETLAGGAGHDTLGGGGDNDWITGDDGNDLILGAWSGVSILEGGSGIDLLDYSNLRGPAGNSRVEIDLQAGIVWKFYDGSLSGMDFISGFEAVTASAMDDLIYGNAGANQLYGAAGNDTLYGASGGDYIVGGGGDDMVVLDFIGDSSSMIGGDGIDTLDYSSVDGSIWLDLRYGVVDKFHNGILDALDNVNGFEQAIGSAHDDTMTGGAIAETLNGNAGNDSIAGGAGKDMLKGDAGNDTVNGEADYDYLDGGDGSDSVAGGDGNDMLYGQDGNDTLNGGAGSDNLRGGAGNDWIVQDVLNDSNNIDGGDGLDTVDYSNAAAPNGGIVVDLTKRTVSKYSNKVLTGADTLAGIDAIIGSDYNDSMTGSASDIAVHLDGGDGDDSLTGGAGAEYVQGGAGNDTLNGSIGDDFLSGGDGDDRITPALLGYDVRIDGGNGFDTLDYSRNVQTDTGIKADLQAGTLQKFNHSYGIGADAVSNFEALIGTRFNDTLAGSSNADVLTGGAGSDSIAGGAGTDLILQDVFGGNDTLDGGADRDTLDYSVATASGARVAVDLKAGSVKKYEGSSLVGTDRVRNFEHVVGTANNDTMLGGAGNDYFEGQAGKDSLDGGDSGNDSLYGGSNSDTLNGGAGNDSLIGGDGNDSVNAGANDDAITQDGWTGNDTLDGGSGFDVVNYLSIATTGKGLDVDLGTGTVAKSANGTITGTDTLRNIEGLVGSSANDEMLSNGNGSMLNGAGGSDVVLGRNGNDTLSGGDGNDYLDGSGGNDLLNAGDGSDYVNGGGGNDTILQDGWGGSDALDGGAEVDLVDYSGYGVAGASIEVNLFSGNVFKLQDGVAIALDVIRNVEIVGGTKYADVMACGDVGTELRGNAGSDSLAGSGGNDTLRGNDGTDRLDGGTGDDSLDGGAGNDALSGGDGHDVFEQTDGWGGNDTLDGGSGTDYASYHCDQIAGASIVVVAGGSVTKYLNGVVVGVDTLIGVEGVLNYQAGIAGVPEDSTTATHGAGHLLRIIGASPVSMADFLAAA